MNTALDISEADAGVLRLRREGSGLAALVQQLVELYEPSMVEHNHVSSAICKHGVIIKRDRSLLNRMIANLLDNETAASAARLLREITVRARGSVAELIVEDDGPGFLPSLRPHVLERFVKGPHSQGHGLGLAFVNAVAQAHGGSVQVSIVPAEAHGSRWQCLWQRFSGADSIVSHREVRAELFELSF